jgi:hypothetical protein
MFRDYFDLIFWQNLEGMLLFLGETFLGRQHSGICDARMVALIAKHLAEGFSNGEGGKDHHPVFEEANKALVAPQWSEEKIRKMREGCVLKANRGSKQEFVKMISFKRLEKLEALSTPSLDSESPASATKHAAKQSSPVPDSSVESSTLQQPTVVEQDTKNEHDAPLSKIDTSASTLSSVGSSPDSNESNESPVEESFITASKFSALLLVPME